MLKTMLNLKRKGELGDTEENKDLSFRVVGRFFFPICFLEGIAVPVTV
jgi:hypothetical protein